MNKARKSISSIGLAVLFAACSSSDGQSGGSGGNASGGAAGNASGGAAGNASGGAAGKASGGAAGNPNGGAAGNPNGGAAGNPNGGAAGNPNGGAAGNPNGGAAGNPNGGAAGNPNGGAAGKASGGAAGGGSGGVAGGATGAGGVQNGGTTGAGGGTSATGGTTPVSTALVTSASGSYWKTGTWTEAASGSATVTVNDTSASQKWDGFGGAFNELGWSFLTTKDMQDQAMTLLFSATDGAAFSWGRIPMGASDYGMSRYTLDDTGTDVTPDSSEGNRPAADTSLSKFSLDRDGQKLIPFIKAALAVKSDLHFWASPWTPPVWMKTGYMKVSGADRTSGTAKKPSYFDGGNMKSDAAILTAYAQYYTKFVQGYKEQGINIELVSPQNEPGYDQNYPSCLWDKTTYTTFIGKYLGPAMKELNVKVMLGTLSNESSGKDIDNAQAAVSDTTASAFLSVAGVQWGVLDKVNTGTKFGNLPIWASEHKCGNYPWDAAYNKTKAPNDQAYGVESWGYIRDAITKGKVTAYNAWNMVLDSSGLGIDTTRDWKQDALLVADGGKVNPTPAYYVFRHLSQYVVPGASVVGTTGGDAVAFKNVDGSIVAVMYNSGAANSSYSVKIGGKILQFAMPAAGWATVKYKP